MSNTEQQVEQEIQSKNLNAPRITPENIGSVIESEHYFTAAQGDAKAIEDWAFVNGSLNGEAMRPVPKALELLTFCVLVLKNGFTVTGESACASPENFNLEIGKRIAYDNARNKIWSLEGYLLKEKLHLIQEKQVTLGELKNNIAHQHEFFSDEENKFVVQLKLTDGAVVTELHSSKNQAVIMAYYSASNYLHNKTNQSPAISGNCAAPSPEIRNDDGLKPSEFSCSIEACAYGSSSSNG